MTEARVMRARAALLDVALQPERWEEALAALAEACGAGSGQLIVRREDGSIPRHWLTGVREDFAAQVEAFGLADPGVNPRAELGLAAAPMRAVLDQDFVSADARKSIPIYAEMFEPFGVAFNCQAVLMRRGDALVRTSVSRSSAQGAFDAESVRAFTALTPALQALVRLHAALASEKLASVLVTLEACAAAALVVDGEARILGVSRNAEALLERGLIRVKNGRPALAAAADDDTFAARLDEAIECSRAGLACDAAPMRVRVSCAEALTLECFALPAERDAFGLGPAALVIVRCAPASVSAMLSTLTEAEAQIAARLAEGESVAAIAEARGVSRETVRSQVKSIFAKLNVGRQAELVSLIKRRAD